MTPDDSLTYRVGDFVRCLRTGRRMLVSGVGPAALTYRYRCDWERDGCPHSGVYRADEIETATDFPE